MDSPETTLNKTIYTAYNVKSFCKYIELHLKLTAVIKLGKSKKICTVLLSDSICGIHKNLL